MNRISSIIIRVRDTLADPEGDRWSDERLLRLIDEAQKDICRRAKLLRTKKNIPIVNGVPSVALPSDMLLLDRVLYNNTVLPFLSHMDMDRIYGAWENIEGTPSILVYDKQNRGETKLYPIPVNLSQDSYVFTSPGYIDNGVLINTDPAFGVVVGMTGATQNTDYGVLTSSDRLPYSETFWRDNLGVTTSIEERSSMLTVYYLKKPKDITSIEDDLEIDDIFNSAIKYYVTGKALRDDMDTQNRIVGNEELQFYDRELKEAISDDMMDFTRNNTQYFTKYIGAFDG